MNERMPDNRRHPRQWKEGRQFRILKRDRPAKNVLEEAGRDR